ncbi:hypothetical protein RJT34_32945 [Clitoria ternatea]|uniref:IBH1-like N-terminal domain-containing protein n=1 Tax=Clitoria ternatea TaxID=43366 RepID=A0AAN9EXW4_CLITE
MPTRGAMVPVCVSPNFMEDAGVPTPAWACLRPSHVSFPVCWRTYAHVGHTHAQILTFLGSVTLQRHSSKTSLKFSLSPTILSRMRSVNSVKQEFLRKWIWGMRKYSREKKNMSLVERKKAIKLSADLAMASTRKETTQWSQALIGKDNNKKVLTGSSSNSPPPHHLQKRVRKSSQQVFSRRIRSGNMTLRRNRRVYRTKDRVVAASSIAKKLVQKRTKRLKSLLPGGEFMDDVSLVEETLDYIQSLRAQVEVMRCLVTASELIIMNPS